MAEATVSAATACKESEMSMAEGAEAEGLVEGRTEEAAAIWGVQWRRKAVSAVAAAAGEDDDATAAAAAAASAALVAATNAAVRFDGGVRSRFKLPLGVRPHGRSGAAKRHVAGHGTLARTANCRPERISCRQLELSSSQARTELAGRKETTLRKDKRSEER